MRKNGRWNRKPLSTHANPNRKLSSDDDEHCFEDLLYTTANVNGILSQVGIQPIKPDRNGIYHLAI